MDTLQVIVSTFTPAAVVGLIALLRSAQADRRALLLQLIDSLLKPEVQEGRRLLYVYLDRYPNQRWIDIPESEVVRRDLEQINRALAFYDTAGWYVRNRYVRKTAFLDNWAVSVLRCWWRSYEPYTKVRREREGWDGWKDFEWIALQAERSLRKRGMHKAIEMAKDLGTNPPPGPPVTQGP